LLRVRILLKKPLILTFSQREKELPVLISLPINDHLLIYERNLIIKPFFKGKWLVNSFFIFSLLVGE